VTSIFPAQALRPSRPLEGFELKTAVNQSSMSPVLTHFGSDRGLFLSRYAVKCTVVEPSWRSLVKSGRVGSLVFVGNVTGTYSFVDSEKTSTCVSNNRSRQRTETEGVGNI
jgi:hypothetical protein